MKLFSYVVAVDAGFAPNPFWGVLTLACCKPKIRQTARPGDLVVGLAPAGSGSGIVYVAKVTEKLTFREYWLDERFTDKRPGAEPRVRRRGDNIYEPVPAGFRQVPSRHSDGDVENAYHKQRDLGGRYVLVAHEFTYFGKSTAPLPERFRTLVVGRAHRCLFPDPLVAEVDEWRQLLPVGVQDLPRSWRDDDDSWRSAR